MTKILPVIMCGGAGTRVWPESRETLPKQFIPLVGDRSTFQTTMATLADPAFEKPIVISNIDYRFLVADQLREIGAEADIVLEPMRRDSGRGGGGRRGPRGAAQSRRRSSSCSPPIMWCAIAPASSLCARRPHRPRRTAISSRSASSRTIRRPAMAISGPARAIAGERDRSSTPSSRSPIVATARSLYRGRLFLELRQFHLPRRCDAERDRRISSRPSPKPPSAPSTARAAISISWCWTREAFARAPKTVDRLCGDGEDRQGCGDSGRHRLVRRRQLARRVGALGPRRATAIRCAATASSATPAMCMCAPTTR